MLRDRIHWQPVPEQMQYRYKLCLLVYKSLRGLAPRYLADFCQPVSSVSARADCDRPHAVTSSSSQLRQILDNALPCLHHWHGTGCHQRSGTISRWSLSSLNSRLICSTSLTSTIISIIPGKHCVEFYLYPTVGTVLIHSIKPELTE